MLANEMRIDLKEQLEIDAPLENPLCFHQLIQDPVHKARYEMRFLRWREKLEIFVFEHVHEHVCVSGLQ